MAGTATAVSSTDALTPPNLTTTWDLAVPLGPEVSDYLPVLWKHPFV